MGSSRRGDGSGSYRVRGFHGTAFYASRAAQRHRTGTAAATVPARAQASARVCARVWTLVVLGVLCGACGVLAAYVALAHARVPDVCDGIDGLNRGEQRTCVPPAPQDVRVGGTDPAVAAYRYARAALPPTEPRTRVYTRDTVLRGTAAHARLAFALAAGGRAALRCDVRSGAALDVLLLDAAQYARLAAGRGGAHDALWSKTGTTRAATTFTARTAGVYSLVAARRSAAVPSYAALAANVTTAAHRVSNATAAETCAAPCVLRAVRADETVVVEYTGAADWVAAPVHRGAGHANRAALAALGVLVALALVFFALFVRELCRTVVVASADTADAPPPAPAGDAPVNENTPATPLIGDSDGDCKGGVTPSAPPAYAPDNDGSATDNAAVADGYSNVYAINVSPY